MVHKIDCLDCRKYFVGLTELLLKDRIRHHKYDTKRVGTTQKTDLTAHTLAEGNQINFNIFTILDNESNYQRSLISEMIHIKKNNADNIREDTQHLNIIYNTLLTRKTRVT